MADKKKKIFSKESSTPRRPVILKSDRDTTKEQSKEKQEKDKQPTIILKTREQSAPKDDRPQSPKSLKSLASEAETSQPSKIAQNDSKDKKTIESKPSAPLKKMVEPVKLLNENLEFNSTALEFLYDSSTNYLVVGVIGLQSVGKSLVMNLIAQNSPIPDICRRILNSHEIPEDDRQNLNDVAGIENQMEGLNFVEAPEKNRTQDANNDIFKFKMQDIDQIQRGVHCTKGIDMYVTKDRIILLDCQAFCSPAFIDEVNTNPMAARSGNSVTIDCLQLTSFLIAVCHVVIAVQDWFTDYNFLRYIQTAEMLKPSLSTSSTVTASQENSESSNSGENHPHLLLLHNRCQLEDYTPQTVKVMQDFYRKTFAKSNLQLNSGMYIYNDVNKNGGNVGRASKWYNIESCGSPINLFLLPDIDEEYDNRFIFRGHPPFDQVAKHFRSMILGVNRHQITSVPNLSEKGWFHYCSKAWDTIRKCTFFIEYERFLP